MYTKGETMTDSIKVPYPVIVEVPVKPELPTISDTVYIDSIQYISQRVDTAKIIHEYTLTNKYAFEVFNDNRGSLNVKYDIQYNKSKMFAYTFTPIHKETKIVQERKFIPFVTVGYNTNASAIIGAGAYLNNIGLEYNFNMAVDNKSYIVNDIVHSKNYHTIKLNYKF